MNKIQKLFTVAMTITLISAAAVGMAAEKDFNVKADEIEYNLGSGVGTAQGHVVIEQDGLKATAGAAEFNSKAKTGTLSGGVVADKDDAHLVSATLVMHSETYVSAIGSAAITKGDKTIKSERINYYSDREYLETDNDWAELSSTDGSVLTAAKLYYDGKTGIARAEGTVEISSPPRKLTAAADRVVYDTNANGTLELFGNATATQDGNTVSGNHLKINNTTNRAEAIGEVKMVYIPKPTAQPAEVDAKKVSGEKVDAA